MTGNRGEMAPGKKRRGFEAAAAAGVFLACLAAERIFLHGGDHGHWWEAVPGFYAMFGFAGGVFLAVAANIVVMRVVKRKEDYYDRD